PSPIRYLPNCGQPSLRRCGNVAPHPPMSEEVTAMPDEVQVVQRLFHAVEHRDRDELLACYAEDVEITEADVLPYGGIYRGHLGAVAHALGFLAAWGPYQGPDEVRLDAQFWGDGAGNACVLFRHRAVDPTRGVRLDAPEVSIYQVRDG